MPTVKSEERLSTCHSVYFKDCYNWDNELLVGCCYKPPVGGKTRTKDCIRQVSVHANRVLFPLSLMALCECNRRSRAKPP